MFAEPRFDAPGPNQTREEAGREWDSLLKRLENMNDDEVREATDQVHEKFAFQVCPDCRRDLHRRIRARQSLL